MPEPGEVFAVVTGMKGYGRVDLRCTDGVDRMGRIPGRMRRRVWVREGDLVVARPWEWEDGKAEIVRRYDAGDAAELRRSGRAMLD